MDDSGSTLQSILRRGAKPVKVSIKSIRYANNIWFKLFTVLALTLFITIYIYYNPLTITLISKSEANNDNYSTTTEGNYYPQQILNELILLLSRKDYYTFNDKLNDKFNMKLTRLNILNTLNNSLIISCGDSIIRYMTETFAFIFSHINNNEIIPNNSMYKHYINILYDKHYYKYGYKPHIFSYNNIFELNIDIIMVAQPKHYKNLNEMYKIIENGQYINKYMFSKNKIIVIHDFVGLHSMHLIPFVYHFAMDKSLTFDLEYYLQEFLNFIIYNFANINENNVYIFYRNTNPVCIDGFYGKWNIAQKEYKILLNDLENGLYENIEKHGYIQKCVKYYEIKELNNTVINIGYNGIDNISLNGYDICIKNTIISNIGVDLWNKRLKEWITYKQKQLILPNRFQLIYYDSHNILKSFYGTCNDTKFHQKDGFHFNGLYLTDLYVILNYINYFQSYKLF